MEKLSTWLNKVLEHFMKFVNTKTMIAVKDGFLLTMPITLIGSIFLLIANFPISNWDSIMSGIFGAGWAGPLNQVVGSTFDILAIASVLAIAYVYARNEEVDGISSALLALVSFLILTNSFTVVDGVKIGGVIPKGWTGGNGVITSIIVGVVSAKIFTFFIKKNIIFKLPEGVPTGVVNAFSALIPGFVIMAGSMLIHILTHVLGGASLTEVIFNVLQTPLQNVSDTLAGGLFITFLMGILFWAGIHGPNIVMGIMGPILTANALSNTAILESGQALVVGENAKVMTIQLIDIFAKFGGQGITIGLVIAALISAKSSRIKEISKVSVVPGLFNINEPVIYGLPIVFNPIMLVPFIVVPLVGVLIPYFAIVSGFMAPFTAVSVPWTTPPIISGFLVSGWRGALVQILIIIASIVIYYPFLKKLDHEYVKEESNN